EDWRPASRQAVDFPVPIDHLRKRRARSQSPAPTGIRPSTAHRPLAGRGLAHVVSRNRTKANRGDIAAAKRGCIGHDHLQAPAANPGEANMRYQIAPVFCRPWTLLGIDRKQIESHYEHNYGGAFTRLNAISDELAALDPATTPPHIIRRLKQDEAAALNS